jgi:hypothetical protein
MLRILHTQEVVFIFKNENQQIQIEGKYNILAQNLTTQEEQCQLLIDMI